MICQNCKSGADLRTRAAAGDMPVVLSWPEGQAARTAQQRTLTLADVDETVAALHAECKGSTWCDCQHVARPLAAPEPAS